MSLKMVLGGSGAGKTHKVYEEIIKESIKNPGKNYYIIVPEQFTMETQKDIINRHPHKGTMNIDIVSFNRLAYRVFGELGINGLSVLDDTGKMLILRKVIEENKSELTIFGNKTKLFGFTEEIKSTISELYQYGINVDDIDEICDRISGNKTMKSKLADIKLIYGKFGEYVEGISNKESKYITKEEILNELCKVVENSLQLKNSTIVLDGFTGFTPVQYKLIGHLFSLAERVMITVTISGDEAGKIGREGFVNVKEHELFNMSKVTVNELIRLAAEKDIKMDKPFIIRDERVYRLKDNESINFLEKTLFRNEKESIAIRDANIQILCASNPIREAQAVADMISNAVRDSEGTLRYRDIAVLTGDMEGYKRVLEEALMANDIPYFVDNKKSLLNNNFVDCIRALLEIIDENFAYEPVFRYLKRGMSNISSEETDIFENYVLGCGIKGFKQYNTGFTKKYKGLTDEELNRCEDIRVKFIEPIVKFKESVENRSVLEVTKAICTFIKENSLYEKLQMYTEAFAEEEREKQEYAQVYRLVMELFEKLVNLLGDEILPLKEYRTILDDGLEEIKVGTIPVVLDQLVIGDIERTRIKDIKALYVIGVNDGIIPRSAGKSGILSQKDRVVLKNASVKMSPTAKENSFIQKFYLYLSLTKPTEKLTLTYSLADFEGNAKKPSYLIANILKNFDGLKVENIEEKENSDMYFKVNSKEKTFKIIAEGLRGYDKNKVSILWKELFSLYCKNDEYADRIKRVLEGAFYVNTDVSLDAALAKEIFGENVDKSITRIEKYARCAYAHFLMYGLNLVPRPVYEIQATDVGNLYHKAVELFSNKLKAENTDFKNVSDELRKELVDISVNEAVSYYGYDSINESSRNRYILEKVRKVTDRSAWAICEHIKRGNFVPSEFEVLVGNGRVDRIDKLESGDCVYVKIIDYKSGNTTFSTDELINGLQLQLVYYLDSVVEQEKRKHTDKKVDLGGVFYFNIKDPVIDYEEKFIEDDSAVSEKLLKEYQMSGIFNSTAEVLYNMDDRLEGLSENVTSSVIQAANKDVDVEDMVKKTAMGLSSENFARVTKFAKNKAKELVDSIYDGDISINPYKEGEYSPCTYCENSGVCAFSKQEFGNSYRRLKKYEKGEK